MARLSHGALWGLGLFGLARLATLVVAWVAMAARPEQGITEILTDWDGNWNEIAAADLYAPFASDGPDSILRWRTLAFFPILPLLTRGLHEISGIGIHVLGPLVSMVIGAAAFAVLGRYLFERVGRTTAIVAMGLMLFSPNGFVLSMFYTEGLMILFTVLTLKDLDEKRWVRAGIFAALGGLTRPSGFVLVVPCVVAAVQHIRSGSKDSLRRWTALGAPLVAPVGFVFWIVYVAVRTGVTTGYFRIQSEAWGARVDFGRTFLTEIWNTLTDIRFDLDVRVSVLAVLVIGIGGLILGYRQNMPATWLALAATLVVVTAVNARQASGARFMLPAFPLFVAWARAIPRQVSGAVIGVSAAAMGALFLVSVTFWDYTP
ncbi:MAG: hypothetical protein ACKOI2_10205 [Actinomycetota bacterium]